MVMKEAALRLKPADKKVVEAFTKKKKADSQLLSSDGRSLRKHGLGSEKVAVWRGPQITIVSTVSAKSDETIIRYLTKVAGKGVVTWEGIKFQTGGDMLYAGQWDGWIMAHVPGVSQPVGRLDWREYDGEYSVKMIEVNPDYQRSGIATALYKKLFKDQGITKRDLGPSMQTPSGDAFRRTLGRVGSSLVPTGQTAGWADGQLYFMPLAKDTFVHFTPAKRADEILASGKLLMNPPYKKMGVDVVAAVSAVWGWSSPKVQTTHIKPGEGPTVAIVFKTTTKPDVAYVEEVLWHRDVALSGAHIVSASKGASLLRNTPERLPDDQDQVSYDRSAMKTAKQRVARRFTAKQLTKQWLMGVRRTWKKLMEPPVPTWIESGLVPVSVYGGKHSREAFAEVFMHYVLDRKMTPQQVETFKLVALGGRFAAQRVADRWLRAAYPMEPQSAVEIRQTDERGKGLFATKAFRRGQTICQMAGPLVDREDRPNFQVGANTWMGTMGPALDSVNHSCGEPNCAALVEQPGRPVIAIEDIAAGDEIMADYSVTSTSPSDGRFECHCGSATCRGRGAGGWHSIPADQQQRYLALGIVPSYVA